MEVKFSLHTLPMDRPAMRCVRKTFLSGLWCPKKG